MRNSWLKSSHDCGWRLIRGESKISNFKDRGQCPGILECQDDDGSQWVENSQGDITQPVSEPKPTLARQIHHMFEEGELCGERKNPVPSDLELLPWAPLQSEHLPLVRWRLDVWRSAIWPSTNHLSSP